MRMYSRVRNVDHYRNMLLIMSLDGYPLGGISPFKRKHGQPASAFCGLESSELCFA